MYIAAGSHAYGTQAAALLVIAASVAEIGRKGSLQRFRLICETHREDGRPLSTPEGESVVRVIETFTGTPYRNSADVAWEIPFMRPGLRQERAEEPPLAPVSEAKHVASSGLVVPLGFAAAGIAVGVIGMMIGRAVLPGDWHGDLLLGVGSVAGGLAAAWGVDRWLQATGRLPRSGGDQAEDGG